MRVPSATDPLRQPPTQPPTDPRLQAMLADPRMERIRQQDPQKHDELVSRALRRYAGGTTPEEAQRRYGLPKGTENLPPIEEAQAGPPFSWQEMRADPAYEAATPDQRELLRRSYYRDFVAPSGRSWEDFDAETAPGVMDRLGQGFSSTGQTLLGQLQQTVGFGLKLFGYDQDGESWLQSGREHLQRGQESAIRIPGEEDASLSGQFNALISHPGLFVERLISQSVPQMVPALAAAFGAGAIATAAAPEAAALAIIAGMLGMGGEAALQRVGEAFDAYRQAHPDAPEEEATTEALKDAGIDGAVNAAAGALGVVGKGLTPLRHTLVQMVVQPAYFSGTQAARNVSEGQPWSRGLVETAATGAALAPAFGLLGRRGREARRPGEAPPEEAAARPESRGEPALERPEGAPEGFRPERPEEAIRQPAPEERPGLPAPENLDQGAEALYQALREQGMPEEQARTEVRTRVRAYREQRAGRMVEVPTEEGLLPGEMVDVQEGPGPNTVRGIVREITPEGVARIQALSEDAAGRDFLSWVRQGMMDELPGLQRDTEIARGAPGEVTKPEVRPPPGSPAEPPPTPVAAPREPSQEPAPQRGIAAELQRLRKAPEAPPERPAPTPDAVFAERMAAAEPELRQRAHRLAKDPERGDDLLQDALLRMWERRDTYDPQQPFENWAQTVLRSVNANRARAFSRRPESALETGREPGEIGVAPEQEARFDLEMGAREAGTMEPTAPVRGAPSEQPPAAEARTQDAARQPAVPERPEAPRQSAEPAREIAAAPADLSQAPLSEIAQRGADLQRQLRLAELRSREGEAGARGEADAIRQQIREVDAARTQAQQRAVREVTARARQVYAHDPPMVRFVDALENKAAGDYQAAKRLMRVSLDALDPVGVFDHEALHDLRRWFLTPLENQVLNEAFAPGARSTRDVVGRLRDLGYDEAAKQAEASTEERIAHAFSLRRMGELHPRPVVARLLDKIAGWMERLGNLFRGRGFTSAEDIFRAIESGEAGGRQPQSSGLRVPERQASQTPLTEETRSRARRIKLPPRKGQTLGERAEEFQRNVTAEQPEDVLDYTVGRNTTRMNWPSEDINRTVAEWRRLTPENQRTTTWNETLNTAARKLRSGEITEQTIIDWPAKKTPSAVEVAAGDMLLSLRAEHLMKIAREAARTGAKEDKARYQLFSAEFALMQGKVHGASSEVARALNIMRARPQLMLDRSRAIESILEQAGGSGRVEEMARQVAALDDPAAIKAYMKKAWTPTWWDRLMEVWVNGLLSNPATHVKNVMGTRAFDDVVQNFDTLVAAGLGRLRGSTDRVYAGEVSAGLYAELRALPEAWKLAKQAYLTEEGPAHLSASGKQEGVRRAIAHPLGKHLFRQPGRALFGEDIFNKAIAYRKELMRLAYRQASQEGLRGQERAARIEKILENPSPDLHLAAMDYADYVTFTRKAGPLAQVVMKAVDAVDLAGAKPLKLILPFIRTPAQLLDVAIEHSPAAVVLKDVRAALAEGGRARDVAAARIIVGSSMLASAFLLAGSGMLTGAGPSDSKMREMWRLGGSPMRPGVPWQPNSLWVGDRYVSIAGVDPISLPLGLAATFVETGEMASEEENASIFGRLLGAFVKNVASKTWLQGLTDAIEVANDPDRYGEHWLRRMAGSAVPAAVAQAARMEDPILRDVQSTMDAVRARVPGWSKTLSPRINVRGEEIELHGAVGPDAFSPFYQADNRPTGPVARELTKLGIAIGPSQKKINGHELTGKQLAEYRADRGARIWKRLETIIRSAGWDRLSPDQKERRIHRAVSFESGFAGNRLKQRYPELRRPARRGA